MKFSVILRNRMHAILKRIGTSKLRKTIWDKEFKEGRWLSGENPERPAICDAISAYLPRGGSLLDLGCSDGIIACTQEGVGKYIGVDISEIAIESAKKRKLLGNCKWVCADISKYDPQFLFDVILFRQSLYYLTKLQIDECLLRYRKCLSERGVFIVVMNNPKRHEWITDIIFQYFDIIKFENRDPLIVVFR